MTGERCDSYAVFTVQPSGELVTKRCQFPLNHGDEYHQFKSGLDVHGDFFVVAWTDYQGPTVSRHNHFGMCDL